MSDKQVTCTHINCNTHTYIVHEFVATVLAALFKRQHCSACSQTERCVTSSRSHLLAFLVFSSKEPFSEHLVFLSPSTPKGHPDTVLSIPIHSAVIKCWILQGKKKLCLPDRRLKRSHHNSLAPARILQEDSDVSVCSAVLCVTHCCAWKCCVKWSAMCVFHTKSIVLCPAAQSSGARRTNIHPL